jgi:hypothetical protein
MLRTSSCVPKLRSQPLKRYKATENVAILSLALLGFTHSKRHFECLATLWQHKIDRVQETLPAVPIGKGKPLQHHERVQVLGEERVAHIVGQPLMETARPVSVSIFRALVFKLFQEPRAQAFIEQIAGVIGDDAVAVLAHARPSPALEPVNVFVELIGKLLGPGRELLPNQDFETALQGILGGGPFHSPWLRPRERQCPSRPGPW